MDDRQTRWSDILATMAELSVGQWTRPVKTSSPDSRRSGSTKERPRALDLVTWVQSEPEKSGCVVFGRHVRFEKNGPTIYVFHHPFPHIFSLHQSNLHPNWDVSAPELLLPRLTSPG